jgi:hypothetical protein
MSSRGAGIGTGRVGVSSSSSISSSTSNSFQTANINPVRNTSNSMNSFDALSLNYGIGPTNRTTSHSENSSISSTHSGIGSGRSANSSISMGSNRNINKDSSEVTTTLDAIKAIFHHSKCADTILKNINTSMGVLGERFGMALGGEKGVREANETYAAPIKAIFGEVGKFN